MILILMDSLRRALNEVKEEIHLIFNPSRIQSSIFCFNFLLLQVWIQQIDDMGFIRKNELLL